MWEGLSPLVSRAPGIVINHQPQGRRMERTFDAVVFGATGFTGKLTAQYLAAHAPRELRWCIAGRSAPKLEALVRELAGASCPPADHLVADVADDASLRALARSTRVLITTVGPYDRYGEPVVRACVEEGAHYLDLTGEPRFVQRIVARYHDAARAAGVKIVPCCGFDSIPHDLGVLFTLDALPRGVPTKVEGFFRTNARFSGGTWHSAMGVLEHLGENRRVLAEAAYDEGGRRGRPLPARVRHEKAIGGWAVPAPLVDPFIVLRSARLLDEYGPDFAYGHYLNAPSLPTVVGLTAGAGALIGLAQVPPVRRWLLSLQQPGEGPSEATRARSSFRVTFLGAAGGREARTEVSGGDPGYTETSKMLAEAALCLVYDGDRTPQNTGVVTPASAMGRPLIERLQRAGIAFRRA
jgi:short subunit dehydrogenase-like uncharacterized protein